ncbi:MAG: ABC transporter permease, partial [Bacteroidales bacterium]|nr:ABC transporter permease [Bacteroidales bacterium]
INILGLTLGLASAILAILYAQHELTYENCHKNYKNIYRVYISGKFGEMNEIPDSFGPEGKELKNMFPEIKLYSFSKRASGTVKVGENLFNEDKIVITDKSFYKTFTIDFINGTPSQNGLTVAISEKIAKRYFGKEDPIDKYMNININGVKKDFLITGVFKDFPSNTMIQYEFIIPLEFASYIPYWKFETYHSTEYINYVILKDGVDYKELNNKIAANYKIPVEIENISAFLMPIKDIHFHGAYQSNKMKFIGLLIGGLFMLLTSCINYINLTNILFSVRGKETGIRKVAGGKRKDILLQYIIDTTLSTLISFNLAIVILKFILPDFNMLMDTKLTLDLNLEVMGLWTGLFVFTILLSGLYPALKHSASKSIILIQDNEKKLVNKNRSMVMLTSFQFFLAIIFIQFMMVMAKQLKYMDKQDIKKYSSENVLCTTGWAWGDLNMVKDELLKNPSIVNVSWGHSMPSMGIMNFTQEWKNSENKSMALYLNFEEDYLDVFSIKLTHGRFFNESFPSDKENSIVINEKMVQEMGYDKPINQSFYFRNKQYNIIGVVEDYRALPPVFNNMPMIIRLSNSNSQFLVIKIKPENSDATQKNIKEILSNINPDYPIELKYCDDYIMDLKQVRSYVSSGIIMNIFFNLCIITSLIGLFGLSVFIAKRHIKEIGIRKVFGASVSVIMLKLLKGLIIQVLIIIVIATPFVYFFSQGFLQTFPFRINPGILFYLSGGGLALLLLLITVSWQTWMAANSNPVKALRYE